ncbi:MAG: hydrogenase maturation protease, partial [Bacteroidetes bacterium]|nr:hydrogenase maturation protease [Bacteroidota bacterium]
MSEQVITILGLGNILMQDEGIGVHIANLLDKTYRFEPEIRIIDGGTTGTDLLPYFEDSNKVLIIDAVNFEK